MPRVTEASLSPFATLVKQSNVKFWVQYIETEKKEKKKTTIPSISVVHLSTLSRSSQQEKEEEMSVFQTWTHHEDIVPVVNLVPTTIAMPPRTKNGWYGKEDPGDDD